MDLLIWQERWNTLTGQVEREGLYSLNQDERLWYNVRSLIDTAEDGGLLSFYLTEHADRMDELMRDLKRLEAQPALDILEEINTQFHEGFPPQTLEEREQAIEAWDEDLFDTLLDRLDDDFYEYLNNLESLLDPIVSRLLKDG